MTARGMLALGFVACGVAIACRTHGGGDLTGPPGLAACGAQFLTVSPLDVSSIEEITPLGNLNPPGHVFPTDHMYFFPNRTAQLVSPGNVVVTSVTVQHRTGGGLPSLDDYSMTYWPCADVQMNFAHINTLAASFSAKSGALDGSCNTPYQIGGVTYQQCSTNVQFSLAAGEPIGTKDAGQGALDIGARDRRVMLTYLNPTRLSNAASEFGDNHAACALDYFTAPLGDALRAKLGGRALQRTAPPVCGAIAQDVPHTASGRWYRSGITSQTEEQHLALVHDNIVPETGTFSVGSSIPGLAPDVYFFTPTTTGRANLDFQYVTTIGTIYCYAPFPGPRILLMLISETRLRIQAFGFGNCANPNVWAFNSSAAEFER